MKQILFATLALLLAMPCHSYTQWEGQAQQRTGTISGLVTDRVTKRPLVGVTVAAEGFSTADTTDSEGRFSIAGVPVGDYVVRFASLGYEPLSRTDVIVRPSRITFVNAELRLLVVEVEGLTVSAGYFQQEEEQPTSAIEFSAEEVRRAPGSAGDVSRIVSMLPSVAKVNDQVNSLIVRGGNPAENGFYVDNIEIPNINHYPVEGSSGGPISLLNTDFINDVSFSAGAFSAAYGDRLSSVMSIEFREGNREEFDGQIDMHMAGLGVIAEGPLPGRDGSWLVSVRRSYLDLLVDAIGTGVAPKYSDYQGKLVYDLSPSHRLTALGVLGIDYIEFEKEQSMEDGNIFYGEFDGYEFATGINWRFLWGSNGYSNTSVSGLGTTTMNEFFETKSDMRMVGSESSERIIQLRNVNHLRLGDVHELEFGGDVKYYINDYDYFYSEYTSALGDTVPPLSVDDRITSPKYGLFASLSLRPFERLTTTFGVRFDHFALSDNSHLSPRFSFSYQLTDRTALNGATGVYYQNLPMILLSQSESNRQLSDPVAYHFVLGLSHLLAEDTRLVLEGYNKEYRNLPVDPAQPPLFMMDEFFHGGFGVHENLDDVGRAYARGVELSVQKKLRENLYGFVSGSYFRTRYMGFDGVVRNRIFDNRWVFSAEGGYKPRPTWELSLRWVFAGGAPYTPLDLVASQAIDRTVFDRTRVNQARYPDYHSLNLRAERRFHFSGSNLIVYLSVWNAYNRKNVSIYYWNEIDDQQDVIYQWSMLPVMGMEFEF